MPQIGFSDADVESLSNVNKSTKIRGSGAIGRKGIGFKSVFAVTSRPRIHSGEYHFQFDSEDPKVRGVARR
jgi:hypothetical protein